VIPRKVTPPPPSALGPRAPLPGVPPPVESHTGLAAAGAEGKPGVGAAATWNDRPADPSPQRARRDTGSFSFAGLGPAQTANEGATPALTPPPYVPSVEGKNRFAYGAFLLLILMLLAGAGIAAVHVFFVPLDVVLVWTRPARLFVSSTPEGAQVRLDGRVLDDLTPVDLSVSRDLSDHNLEVSKEGFHKTERRIRFDDRAVLVENVPLQPRSAPSFRPLPATATRPQALGLPAAVVASDVGGAVEAAKGSVAGPPVRAPTTSGPDHGQARARKAGKPARKVLKKKPARKRAPLRRKKASR
jgi:hypothetical protein